MCLSPTWNMTASPLKALQASMVNLVWVGPQHCPAVRCYRYEFARVLIFKRSDILVIQLIASLQGFFTSQSYPIPSILRFREGRLCTSMPGTISYPHMPVLK